MELSSQVTTESQACSAFTWSCCRALKGKAFPEARGEAPSAQQPSVHLPPSSAAGHGARGGSVPSVGSDQIVFSTCGLQVCQVISWMFSVLSLRAPRERQSQSHCSALCQITNWGQREGGQWRERERERGGIQSTLKGKGVWAPLEIS